MCWERPVLSREARVCALSQVAWGGCSISLAQVELVLPKFLPGYSFTTQKTFLAEPCLQQQHLEKREVSALGGGGGAPGSDSSCVLAHSPAQGTVPREWVALQMVREETGDRIPSFRPSICLRMACPPSCRSPRRASCLPLAPSSHGRMPFPSWPAVKPLSWRICMSLCDPSQMVPANISCHCAMTSSSLTCVPMCQEGGPSRSTRCLS